MKLYDTLSKSKKELIPRSDNKIEIFVCGPTVYDLSHIGHARTYIAFDAFAKYLKFKGFDVRYVQNITDIDDKIIDRAKQLNQTPKELATNFEAEYFHDMEALGVDSVDKYARATDHMSQIISQVSRLLEKGFAYKAEDGIYFDISKFKDYGKLSGRTAQQAEDAVSRIDESVNKRNKGDFALWKFAKADEPKWDSPWGEGRPGWHIEDTAITETEFGPQYDIHGGARDLIFPHHESEIAQMEAISGNEPLVNYWVHTGFLTTNGEKMSKSLGNFLTIRDLLANYSKEIFRLFILSSHYRSPIDYKESAIDQAKENVASISEFYTAIFEIASKSDEQNVEEENEHLTDYKKRFYAELDDDFNTPKAIAVLFELMKHANPIIANDKLPAEGAHDILKFLNEINSIFGIILTAPQEIPEEVRKLAEAREALRKENRWQEADVLRKEIEDMGYMVEDTENGPKIKEL